MTRITSKGQVTIPKAIREVLQARPGDRLSFMVQDDGSVTVQAETVDLNSLQGRLSSGGRHVTLEQMNQDIRKAAAKR